MRTVTVTGSSLRTRMNQDRRQTSWSCGTAQAMFGKPAGQLAQGRLQLHPGQVLARALDAVRGRR